MQYALLIYTDPQAGQPEDFETVMAAYNEFTANVQAEGIMVAGEALHDVETATTVRVRDGAATHTDGPFAETKEVFGGFYIVDVPDLDAAIAVAERLPGSWWGSVEVRPIVDFNEAQ
jgi:hypothetical protein